MTISRHLSLKAQAAKAILSGITFALLLMLFDTSIASSSTSLQSYIISGTIFGLIYGFISPFITKYLSEKLTSSITKGLLPTLAENEVIEKKGTAKLKTITEVVGGYLFLTNKRLIFVSGKVNTQKIKIQFEYSEIESIIKKNTAIIISDSLQIVTPQGEIYEFSLMQRNTWHDIIQSKLNYNQ